MWTTVMRLLDHMKQFIGKEFPIEEEHENVTGFSFNTKPDVSYRVSFEHIKKDRVKITDIKETTVLKISKTI